MIKTVISYTKQALVAAFMHEASFDVILIGYGPVSQGLALMLGRHGNQFRSPTDIRGGAPVGVIAQVG